MKGRYVSAVIRSAVASRAEFRCEYCLVAEIDLVYIFQLDHIISFKHGGSSEIHNLAYACSFCNQAKGSDLGTYLPGSNRLIRLFHPRRDRWRQHFTIDDGEIIALTKIGAATVQVLELNQPDRILLRRELMAIGHYPQH